MLLLHRKSAAITSEFVPYLNYKGRKDRSSLYEAAVLKSNWLPPLIF